MQIKQCMALCSWFGLNINNAPRCVEGLVVGEIGCPEIEARVRNLLKKPTGPWFPERRMLECAWFSEGNATVTTSSSRFGRWCAIERAILNEIDVANRIDYE